MGIGVHVVTAANRHLYADQIEDHYRRRHEIYVGERGWMDLDRPDGREVDQFDNQDAVYLLALEGNKVVGGSRLVPTLSPHLISDVFPDMAAIRGIPCGEDIYEWTRIFVVPERREENSYSQVGSQVMCAIQELALEEGIERLTAIVEMWWLQRFFDCGWDPQPLGLPRLLDGSYAMAIEMKVSDIALNTTREFRNVTGPCLERHGPQQELVANRETKYVRSA